MSKIEKGTATKKAEEKKGTAKTTNAVIKKVSEIDEIKRELEKIKQENENLKKGKLKLSYEEAEKLYLKKAELIKDLKVYQEKKETFVNLSLGAPEDSGLLDYDDYNLKFTRNSSSYRDEYVLSTSNKLIIKEFIPFIIQKLDNKINELKTEIEIMDL